MTDTILIVDDEEPVRRTFAEWLAGGLPECRVLVAADAEEALRHANQHGLDLAILDWNLGPATMACGCSKICRSSSRTSSPSSSPATPTRPRRSTPCAWASAITSTRTRT